MKVSLLISTYNRPDALARCLESALAQTRLPDEIVVGDDGSTDQTRQLVERIAAANPGVPIVHVWHEDAGFRLAKIRNRSIAKATGEYIIQVDGDMVLNRHFVEDHLSVARPGFFVLGGRIRLNGLGTDRMLRSHGSAPYVLPWSRYLEKDRLKAFRLPLLGKWLSPRYKRNGSGIGANMAFWKSDLLKVNGYDEWFEGWGGEDTDLEMRLKAAGVESFKLFRLGLAYHLKHREKPNDRNEALYQYTDAKLRRGEIVAKKGIENYE